MKSSFLFLKTGRRSTAKAPALLSLAAAALCALGLSPLSAQVAAAPPAAPVEKPAPVKIACVGDSITAGYGLQKGERAYPSQLLTLLGNGYRVSAFGASGRTFLSNGDQPYLKTGNVEKVAALQPDVVIILLGTNDAKPQNFAKIEGLFADAVAMIRTFRELPGHLRVLLGLPAPVYKTAYQIEEANLAQVREVLKAVAAQEKVPVIDLNAALSGHPEWFPDGVHPTGEGAAALAKAVAGAVQATP